MHPPPRLGPRPLPLHLGTALLLLSCILSLVYLVARQISHPLKRLARVADEVRRTGDHSHRAHWTSRDEIGKNAASVFPPAVAAAMITSHLPSRTGPIARL